MSDNFLTLSELAKGLNKNELQVRRAFKKLITLSRLTEGADFVRENEKDDLHFVYRINPLRFLEEVKKIRTDIKPEETDSIVMTDGQQIDSKSVINSAPVVDIPPRPDDNPDTNRVITSDETEVDSDFDLDSNALIDFFKAQLVAKDHQIERKDAQIESLTKAIGQTQGMNIELNKAVLYLVDGRRDSRREPSDVGSPPTDINRDNNSAAGDSSSDSRQENRSDALTG